MEIIKNVEHIFINRISNVSILNTTEVNKYLYQFNKRDHGSTLSHVIYLV